MKSHLRVHYFQHIAGEGFGSCYSFLKAHHATISSTEFFALPVDRSLEIEALPRIEEVDLLLIMGGTMSVNDEANYPWLKIEKKMVASIFGSRETSNRSLLGWAANCECIGCSSKP